MTQVQEALSILGDRTGFFPESLRASAQKIIEEHGTEQEKELASKCALNSPKVIGPLTQATYAQHRF